MERDEEEKGVGQIVRIDEGKIRAELGELVRGTVEETLNGLLEAEAASLCQANRYERTRRAAGHPGRALHAEAGDARRGRSTLQMPKLRKLPFETSIIERYQRRESSVEEALIEMYLAGVSVRRVEDITEALWGTRVIPSHGEQPEPEDLRADRGVAEPAHRRRPIPMSTWTASG